MSYRQYTKCASISAFVGFMWVQYVMLGGAAIVAGYLTYILGAAFVPGLLITILSAIIAYCLWWLYDRLICLGSDVCAVGFVLSVEPPDEKSGPDAYDTDYSLNLVLPPTLMVPARQRWRTPCRWAFWSSKPPMLLDTLLADIPCPLALISLPNSVLANPTEASSQPPACTRNSKGAVSTAYCNPAKRHWHSPPPRARCAPSPYSDGLRA